MEDPPADNSEGGSNVPSREKFNTAIGDLSAKLESLMRTMSQVVHGTAPATTGDRGESRGGRHTAPGAEQQGLDQGPNTPAATGDGGESRGGRHTAPGAEQQGLDQAPNNKGLTRRRTPLLRRAAGESHGAAGTPLQATNRKGLIRRRTLEEH